MSLYIVTGAGPGLGRALALELAERGVDVAAFGRNRDAFQALADAEHSDLGYPDARRARIHPVICDVADLASVTQAFAQADALGTLNGLVNNAATYPRRDLLDEKPEGLMQVMATNFGGTAACALAALARFTQTGQGRLLNVATFADLAPISASAAYDSSKGAARILTRALVADIADRFPRIIISDWMPGILATDIGIPEGLDSAVGGALRRKPSAVARALVTGRDMGHEPRDPARARAEIAYAR